MRRCRRQVLFKQFPRSGVVLTCDLAEKHEGWHQLVLEVAGKPGKGAGYLLWSCKRGAPFVSEPGRLTRTQIASRRERLP